MLATVSDVLRVLGDRHRNSSWSAGRLCSLFCAAVRLLQRVLPGESGHAAEDDPFRTAAFAAAEAALQLFAQITHNLPSWKNYALLLSHIVDVSEDGVLRLALSADCALRGSAAGESLRLRDTLEEATRIAFFAHPSQWLMLFRAEKYVKESSGDSWDTRIAEGAWEQMKCLGEWVGQREVGWRSMLLAVPQAGAEMWKDTEEQQEYSDPEEDAAGEAEAAEQEDAPAPEKPKRALYDTRALHQLFEALSSERARGKKVRLPSGWAAALFRAMVTSLLAYAPHAGARQKGKGSPGVFAVMRFVAVLAKVAIGRDRHHHGASELAQLVEAVEAADVYHSQTDLLYHSGVGFHVFSAVAAQVASAAPGVPAVALRAATTLLRMYHKLVEPQLGPLCAAAVTAAAGDAGRGFVIALLDAYSSLHSLDAAVAPLAAAALTDGLPRWLCGVAGVYRAPMAAALDPLPAARAALGALAPRAGAGDVAAAEHLTAVAEALCARSAAPAAAARWVDDATKSACRPLSALISTGKAGAGGDSWAMLAALLSLYCALQSVLDAVAPQLLTDVFEWGTSVAVALLGPEPAAEPAAGAPRPEDVPLLVFPGAGGGAPETQPLRDYLTAAAGRRRAELAAAPPAVQQAAARLLCQRARRIICHAAVRSWQGPLEAAGAAPAAGRREAELRGAARGALYGAAASIRRILDGGAEYDAEADCGVLRTVLPHWADLTEAAGGESEAAAAAAEQLLRALAEGPSAEPRLRRSGPLADLAWRCDCPAVAAAPEPAAASAEPATASAAGRLAAHDAACGVLSAEATWECVASAGVLVGCCAHAIHRGQSGRLLRAARAVLRACAPEVMRRLGPRRDAAAAAALAVATDGGLPPDETAVARDCVTDCGLKSLTLALEWARADDAAEGTEAQRQSAVRAAWAAIARLQPAEVVLQLREAVMEGELGDAGDMGPATASAVALALLRVVGAVTPTELVPHMGWLRGRVQAERGRSTIERSGGSTGIVIAVARRVMGASPEATARVCERAPYAAGAAVTAMRLCCAKEDLGEVAPAVAAALGASAAASAGPLGPASRWLAANALQFCMPLIECPKLKLQLCSSVASRVLAGDEGELSALAEDEPEDADEDVRDGVESSLFARLALLGNTEQREVGAAILGWCRAAFDAAGEAATLGDPPPPQLCRAATVMRTFTVTCPRLCLTLKDTFWGTIDSIAAATHLIATRGHQDAGWVHALCGVLRLVCQIASHNRGIQLSDDVLAMLLQLPNVVCSTHWDGPHFPTLFPLVQRLALFCVTRRAAVMPASLWPLLIGAIGGCIRGLLRWVQRSARGGVGEAPVKERPGTEASRTDVAEAEMVDGAVRLLELLPGARRDADQSETAVGHCRAVAPALLQTVVGLCVESPVAANKHHRDLARGVSAVMLICSKLEPGKGLEPTYAQLPAGCRPMFKAFHQAFTMSRGIPG
eukprot:TRINITY_DN3935_c1_g2_i1.p1 TRINITY_DN3935_c1_g2~~TRINITY_DN3935_c1_g2_i1.p1  ORF type:complete len:1591 (+),score=481.49 TRINITY_DN3935_c1_g2_i1:399-4775(+)